MRSRRSVAARGWYQDVERFRVWMSEYIRGYKESMKRKKKHKKKKNKTRRQFSVEDRAAQ